jgi:tryptophan synthase beta subunit
MDKPSNKGAAGPGSLKHSDRSLPFKRKPWPRIASMALMLTAVPLSRAAGLGELQKQSALGEPLDVVINLSDDTGRGAEDLTARIATEDTYDALGLRRDRALEGAGVSIEKGQGALRLHVSGPRLVMEPILSLVVEVNFGTGIIRRNYDLLMDPPPAGTYDHYAGAGDSRDQAAEPVRPLAADSVAPAVVARSAASPAPRPEPRSGDAVRVAHRVRPVAAPEPGSGDSYGPVPWGTTLGDIAVALRARPDLRLPPLVRALYEANPQAFSGGPSRLLAGAWLHIPQTDLFRHGVAPAAFAAEPASAAVPVPPPAAPLQAPEAVAATAASAQPAMALAAPSASLLPYKLRLAERLDLSTVALGAATLAPVRPAQPGLARAAEPRAAAQPAAGPLSGAAAAPRAPAGRSVPWHALFSFPLWGGIAVVWLGFAWVRVRRSLAHRIRPVPAGKALAAPQTYPTPILSAPMAEYSGLSAPSVRNRKLHASERTGDFAAFQFQVQDTAPAATRAPAGAAAGAAAAVIEVDDTSQYSDAEDFLVSALALHPERADLRLKLLEIYSAAGNLKGFTEQAQQYVARNKGERSAHWNEVRRMGLDLDPNWSLLKATGQEPSTPAAANAPESKVRRFYDSLDEAGLETALRQLEAAYARVRNDPAFVAAIVELCASEVGLPTPYWYAEALSKRTGGAQIYIKREDLRPLNTDLMVNALGQVMLAKWTGRSSVVAGMEDGRHGEAVAKAAKALNIPAIICVPLTQLNDADHPVIRSLSQLNAILIPTGDEDGVAVPDGRRSAMKRWLAAPDEILYISSLRSSPAPYPIIVRDFQALIGQEIRRQAFRHAGGLPRAIVSSIDGGYATFGLIQSFLEAGDVRIDCVEMQHAADEAARPAEPGAPSYARELNWLRTTSRVNFSTVSKEQVASTVEMCSQAGETIPRPNNACALAQAVAIARELPSNSSVVALFA